MAPALHCTARGRAATGRLGRFLAGKEYPWSLIPPSSAARAIEADLSEWSGPAEFIDARSPIVSCCARWCRLGAGRWQWSISSLGGDSGELICAASRAASAGARRTRRRENRSSVLKTDSVSPSGSAGYNPAPGLGCGPRGGG